MSFAPKVAINKLYSQNDITYKLDTTVTIIWKIIMFNRYTKVI
jgi:hypothetical protein